MNVLKQRSPPAQRSPQNAYNPTSPDISRPHQNQSNTTTSSTAAQINPAISLVTASTPLLMGGEHSAFRSLVPPSAAAFLAASVSLSQNKSYTTSSSPHSSDESDTEINVHDDESDVELSSDTGVKSQNAYGDNNSVTPLQLTTHDRQ